MVVDSAPKKDGAPVPLYADLFVKGTKWKIAVKTKSSGLDDNGNPKTTNTTSNGTCSVAEVSTYDWGLVSQIACKDFAGVGETDPLSGYWVATSFGLFRSFDAPTAQAAPPLTRATLVLNAAPSLSKIEDVDPATDHGQRFEVEAKGKAWCHTHFFWGGDEAWKGVCLEPQKGFVSGKWGWAGGSVQEHELTATKSAK